MRPWLIEPQRVRTKDGHRRRAGCPTIAWSAFVTRIDDAEEVALGVSEHGAVVFAGRWVLDHASPTERARLLASQPRLLRLVYRLALRPR